MIKVIKIQKVENMMTKNKDLRQKWQKSGKNLGLEVSLSLSKFRDIHLHYCLRTLPNIKLYIIHLMSNNILQVTKEVYRLKIEIE